MPLPAYRGGSTLVDQTRAQDFNLAVLQRIDAQIQEILYSATHVAVYEFDTKGKYWKRSNIEGTLFLVKRQVQPRCQIIVMNGKGTENFYEVVDGSLETEMLDTFLLYTKGNNQLYGIWFYEDKNCDEFAEYLNKIIRGMPKPSRSFQSTERGEQASSQAGANGAGGDDDSFWDAKNVQSSSGHPKQQLSNDAGAASCPPPSGVNGENDLMRLFRQAKERGPAMAESATPPPQPQAPPPQPFTQQSVIIQVPPPISNPAPGPQPPARPAAPSPQPVAPPQQAIQQPAPPQPAPQPAQPIAPQQVIHQPVPTLMLERPQTVHPSVTTLTLPTTPPPNIRPLTGLNPAGIPENAGVRALSPSPPASVSVPYPLPPEFFKSSKENGAVPPPPLQQQQGVSSQNIVRVMSPDPNLLPLPSMPSLLSDTPPLMNPATISAPLGVIPGVAAAPHIAHQFDSLAGDSRDVNGLARFFPTVGGDGPGQTLNNTNNGVAAASIISNTAATNVLMGNLDQGRNKFRQAIAILMQDDDFVDRFIAGFKRAGLDIS
ncbi:hypothetical protein BSKO_11147 [Bryopsis sp. KO-2023]|nr:hypothetical protein BSKO_11147 [Bryopsis sp. KO-2023]